MNTLSPPQIAPTNRTLDGVRSAERLLSSAATNPALPFNEILNQATTGDGLTLAQRKQKEAEKVAGDLVAQALILPMLKQLRQGSLATNTLFGGGLGEKTFGPEFDIQIADRLAHSPQLGIQTSLAARILKRAMTAKTQEIPANDHKVNING